MQYAASKQQLRHFYPSVNVVNRSQTGSVNKGRITLKQNRQPKYFQQVSQFHISMQAQAVEQQQVVEERQMTTINVAGLNLLVRPLVSIGDILNGIKENNAGPIEKIEKASILAIDGGGIKGLIPIQILFKLEKIIKQYILTSRVTGGKQLPLISQNKIQEILSFRSERLKESNLSADSITSEDFDILLSDYFEFCAGTSTGSIIAAFISTTGLPNSQQELLSIILTNSAQSYITDSTLLIVNRKRTIQEDIEDGMENKKYQGIFSQQGTIQGLYYYYYHLPELIFSPNPQPNLLYPGSVVQQNQPGFLGPKIQALRSRLEFYKVLLRDRNYLNRYSSKGVEKLFQICFGDKMLSDPSFYRTSLYIPSFDLEHKRPMSFFKLLKPQRMDYDHGLVTTAQIYDNDRYILAREVDLRLADVVQASTAAPTYFPGKTLLLPTGKPTKKDPNQPPQIDDENLLCVDGGVVSGNPLEQAVSFITKDQRRPLTDYSILSMGCGFSENLILATKQSNIKYVLEVLTDVMQNSDTFVNPFQANLFDFIMDEESFVRCQRVSTSDYNIGDDPTDQAIGIKLDDFPNQLDALVAAGNTIADHFEGQIKILIDKFVMPRALYKASQAANPGAGAGNA